MKSLRKHRRTLGAILLTTVCLVVSVAPATAQRDRDAAAGDYGSGRISMLFDSFERGLASVLQTLYTAWAADGAHIED